MSQRRLSLIILAVSIDPNSISLNSLLDPVVGAGITLAAPLRIALAFLSVLFAPGGKIAQLIQPRALERPPEI